MRFSNLKSLSWPRCCVVLVLVDSWLFVFSAGVLIHGVGMSSSIDACSAGIFLCIWLYAVSKLLIYCFLIEKVRAVWGASQPRLASPVYIVCLLVMLPFFAFPAILIVGRIAYFRSDMACVLGLKPYSSISLLVYDLCINLFLNGMFLWPLLRYRLTNPRMRAVARRTLWAAAAALITSIVNVAVLTVLHTELGWVTLNALVLFWVTSSTGRVPNQNPTQPSLTEIPYSAQSKPTGHSGSPALTLTSPPLAFVPPGERPRRDSIGDAMLSAKSLEAVRQDLSLEDLATPLPRPSSREEEERAKSPRLVQMWRRLSGLPTEKKQKEVKVHISVITQHEFELCDVEGPNDRQGGESNSQLPSPNEWRK